MAITQALCTSYKKEVLQGVHLAADVYKIALFTAAANLSAATTAYATAGEATGAGYTAGGVNLSGFAVTDTGGVACLDFADPSWSNATITARGALIYNSTRANKAVAVLDFGADITSTNGTFTVQFPAPGAAGLITIS